MCYYYGLVAHPLGHSHSKAQTGTNIVFSSASSSKNIFAHTSLDLSKMVLIFGKDLNVHYQDLEQVLGLDTPDSRSHEAVAGHWVPIRLLKSFLKRAFAEFPQQEYQVKRGRLSRNYARRITPSVRLRWRICNIEVLIW